MKRTLSAVEARKKLGEVLEGVYYRGDEVIIERAGKPMAVVIPAHRYANMQRRRDEFWKMIDELQERNKDMTPEEVAELEKDIDEAVKEVRAERRAEREKKATVSE